MMLEANCRAVLPAASPCPCPDDGAPLGAAGWGVSTDSTVVDLAVMASPAAEENIINEDTDLQGAEDTEGCTETEDNGDCASFCRKVPEPLLPRPASPQVVKKQAGQSSTRRRRRTLAPRSAPGIGEMLTQLNRRRCRLHQPKGERAWLLPAGSERRAQHVLQIVGREWTPVTDVVQSIFSHLPPRSAVGHVACRRRIRISPLLQS